MNKITKSNKIFTLKRSISLFKFGLFVSVPSYFGYCLYKWYFLLIISYQFRRLPMALRPKEYLNKPIKSQPYNKYPISVKIMKYFIILYFYNSTITMATTFSVVSLLKLVENIKM